VTDGEETSQAALPAACRPALTAYPQTEAALRQTLAGARVDARSFSRRLARCSLSACRGMCCYDGVYVDEESAAVIQEIVEREAPFFRDLGLALPDQVIVDGEWDGAVEGRKTAVVPYPFSRQVPGYPGHFADTACVFHLADGRCALQVLADARGRHPWYYKPFTCWLHPIAIEPGDGDAGAVIHLEDETTDAYQRPDYDGYVTRTFCGRTTPCGQPAHEVLTGELTVLGQLAGRDLVAEARTDLASG
jgi:hypothetical protein